MFLLFNHSLTHTQEKEAQELWKVDRFISLPPDLKKIWAQIPADRKEISSTLTPLHIWLETESEANDLVLVQGDFGATWLMVNFALTLNLIAVYSVTVRDAQEEIQPDGTVKNVHFFSHRMFRRYGV